VAFLVKTSVLLAVKLASKLALVQDFFMNSFASFAWYDPDTSFWKTSQQSLLTDLESYSENWPRQGLIVNGVAYEHRIWEPVIVVTDGGLLPTPTARDHKDSGEKVNYEKLAKKSRLAGILVTQCSTQNGGATYLNPCFLEEMMGYPIGWTELGRLEIQ
jgi:hypothetical protein